MSFSLPWWGIRLQLIPLDALGVCHTRKSAHGHHGLERTSVMILSTLAVWSYAHASPPTGVIIMSSLAVNLPSSNAVEIGSHADNQGNVEAVNAHLGKCILSCPS
eukprot:266384-Pelagomonas_calceolata.AAC.1